MIYKKRQTYNPLAIEYPKSIFVFNTSYSNSINVAKYQNNNKLDNKRSASKDQIATYKYSNIGSVYNRNNYEEDRINQDINGAYEQNEKVENEPDLLELDEK